jgi:hypothetical protein
MESIYIIEILYFILIFWTSQHLGLHPAVKFLLWNKAVYTYEIYNCIHQYYLHSVHPVVCHKHVWLRLAVITTNDL